MDDEKLAELYVDIIGRTDKIEAQLNRLKKTTTGTSKRIRDDLSKAFENKLAKKKISELILLQKKLRKEFQRKVKLNVSRQSLDWTRSKLGQVESALHGVQNQSNKMGMPWIKKMIAGLGLAYIAVRTFRKALSFSIEAKNAQRDAYEIQNKFDEVFISLKKKANATADALSAAFKLAGSTTRKLLGDVGDVLVGFGFTEKQSLDLSKRVVELSQDLASFTNFEGGAERATQALTKALVGETESAKALGIVLRQDTKEFNNQVAEIKKTQGATETQARALVLLDEAYRQSRKAIGDFQRTQESLANQERILLEAKKELREEIGRRLAPTFLAATRFALKLTKALTPQTTALEVATKRAAEQRIQFETLINTYSRLRDKTSKTKIEHKLYSDTIKELHTRYGDYLGDINLESGAFNDVKIAIDKARKSLLEYAKTQAVIATQKDTFNAIVKSEAELVRLNQELSRTQAEISVIREKNLKNLGPGTDAAKAELILRNTIVPMFKKEEDIRKKISIKEQESIQHQQTLNSLIEEYGDKLNQAVEGGGSGGGGGLAGKIKSAEDAYKIYYETLKYDAQDYYKYRAGLIDSLVAEIATATGDEVKAERLKYFLLKELYDDYVSYLNEKQPIERRGDIQSTEPTPILKEYKPIPDSMLDEQSKSLEGLGEAFSNGMRGATNSVGIMLNRLWGGQEVRLKDLIGSFISEFIISLIGRLVANIPVGHSGGTFAGTNSGVKKVASFAGGGDFTVPRGFPNDSYPMFVESGERVKVTPAGRVGGEVKMLKTINGSIQALTANMMETERRLNLRIDGTLEAKGSSLVTVYDKADKIRDRYS